MSPPRVLLEPMVESAKTQSTDPWSGASCLLMINGRCIPEIDERLYLSLGLPPLLRWGICAFMRETSEFKLLPCEVEMSAGDLSGRQQEVTKG